MTKGKQQAGSSGVEFTRDYKKIGIVLILLLSLFNINVMRYLIISFIFLWAGHHGYAQSSGLAKNYFEQGEYVKAASIYQQLYRKNNNSFSFLKGWVSSLQQQEKYEEAGKNLREFAKRRPNYPGINVEIGHNYQLWGKEEKAEIFYKKALASIEKRPAKAYRIGNDFHKINLLQKAIQAYQIALSHKSSARFIIELALLYGEQGKYDQMFSYYLDLILENEQYYRLVNRHFSRFITTDPHNKANQSLRMTLIKRIQTDPKIFYNRLLSWLYVQEDQFMKAFIQEKAVYRRSSQKDLSKIIQLARIAAEKNEYQTANDILTFAIEKALTTEQKLQAYGELMEIKMTAARPASYQALDKEFSSILSTYGKGPETLRLQLQYATFLAFMQQQTDRAKSLLNQALALELNRFESARVKMKLADVWVAEEKFNQALIYYSQIAGSLQNSPIARKATFKVAKTSYYKGDFAWAQTQLKVLKEATSDLIANNALALNLLIETNKGQDSTQAALKQFARADLLATQGKTLQSIEVLKDILIRHKGTDIEDDALFRLAKLQEKQAQYQAAAKNYQKIIQYYADGPLADDAYYYLAELYRNKLNLPQKAMENYKQIIFHHSDSIFYVNAREKFRQLRGDELQ